MLKDKIAASEAQMRAKLQEARVTFSHRGDKGTTAEDAFRAFLRQYLPRRLEVGHGEVIDSAGSRSSQTDVVVVNDEHPYTFTPDLPGLFFVEGVSAAGEVKSVLTSDSLLDALEKSRKFKQLVMKVSKGTQVFANPSDLNRFYKCPPWFLLAFESQLSLERARTTITEFSVYNSIMPNSLVDAIFLLDRGWIINLGDGHGSFGFHTDAGQWLTGWQWAAEQNILFTLLGWLSVVMPRMSYPVPVLAKYLLEEYAGEAKNVE